MAAARWQRQRCRRAASVGMLTDYTCVVGLSGASAEFLGLRLFLEGGFFLKSRDGLGVG